MRNPRSVFSFLESLTVGGGRTKTNRAFVEPLYQKIGETPEQERKVLRPLDVGPARLPHLPHLQVLAGLHRDEVVVLGGPVETIQEKISPVDSRGDLLPRPSPQTSGEGS